MRTLVENFTNQIKEAIAIAGEAKFTPHTGPINNVVIAGMGGSGIGGTIVSELVRGNATVPIEVAKGYFLPSYVDERTLVIASSYSGNTEETVKSLNQALAAKAKVVCITSGGELMNIAQKHNLNHVELPKNMPPRACLGYSLVAIFFTLYNFGIIQDDFKNDLLASITLLNTEEQNIKSEAEEIAKFLMNKIPAIYAVGNKEGIAVRWRQQLNENAKMLAWTGAIPEMNHNELMGWSGGDDRYAVVILESDFEYTRNMKRVEITKRIIGQITPHVYEAIAKGDTMIEKTLYLIHLGDWASVFLSEMRGVDPNDIHTIEDLKSSMGTFEE